jgi:hypothetical protein
MKRREWQVGPEEGRVCSSLVLGKLPIRRPMIWVAVLDEAHRCEGATVEAAANRRPVLVDRAATIPQVNAAPICAPLQDQFAIVVPLCQQVGQAFPITLLVHGDARIIAAG